MAVLVAVVDDEPDILELLREYFERFGFEVVTYPDASSFLKGISDATPDVVILDIMLPDMDGFEVARLLRSDERFSHIPILMLTARGEEADRVLGLELGADDYVVKPFSPRELVARVKALLRRAKGGREEVLVVGDLRLYPERFEAFLGERPLELTTTEFRLLAVLARYRGKVLSRQRILRELWGDDKAVTERSVDVHIKKLRDKLGEASGLIKSVRGMGYKLQG